MKHIILPVLCLTTVMSIVSFALMGYDKKCARSGKWRVKERTLFIVAACFGALGGVLGMRVFRHKTRHWYFRIFFPALLILQAALIAAVLYFAYL